MTVKNITPASLAGVMPPLPTPFDAQGEVALGKLRENLDSLNRFGLTGFVILGSNGEYVYLEESEKLAAIAAARESIPSDKLLVAGTGTESTRATIRLTRAAAENGADVAIVITPGYYKNAMTGEAMVAHFTALAEASTIPIVLYNMPAYAGIDMSVDTILKLAAHPNIIGLKESSGNLVKIGELVQGVAVRKLDFAILAGSASFLLPTLAVGGMGGVAALANIAPQQCLDIYNYFRSGHLEEAQQVQLQVLAANAAVTTRFGVAGLKYAMDKLGMYGGAVRPPLLPLNAAAASEIDGTIESMK
ncbi:MAG: dihydrodipicolinate synthase family protein [Chloroflexi bacterium]|uniref:Dihydrodipicolinate synthase family protein n=1 Tax=Candidatus Chlorohelix allophototropha TaxID=3003348 RepID=A0A8T7M8V8_9CHLR|nr:dihydrodipicolinate synthase family protein [Chloroflexota bacterium]WJW68495.1 dihydrodipicolinate synthase family protein [Chloroflexota bacterium L227-S17]